MKNKNKTISTRKCLIFFIFIINLENVSVPAKIEMINKQNK